MSASESVLSGEQLAVRLRRFMQQRGSAYGLTEIGYFGSYARGEADAASDVDIVYRMAPSAKPTLWDLASMREELEAALGRPVDLIEMRDRLAAPLRERIRREARYV